jgi:type VI secretion system protein ImpA
LPELISQLLEPVSAESPCGQDLRYEPEYDQLRELRREDDTSLPTGVWQSQVKRAQWPELEKLATALLLERS